MYDRVCHSCKAERIDSLERIADSTPEPCPCGGELVRGYAVGSKSALVVGDDIPGGILIKHGVCNEDGTPRRFYSKSEIRRAAKEKGLTWGGDHTEHVPSRGSDRNPHTSRWV